jgi:hypothetical protein
MSNLAIRVGDKEGLPIRARDVAFELKDKNVDPAVVALLMKQAEISFVHDKAIADMASMFDMMMKVCKRRPCHRCYILPKSGA